MIIFTNMKLNNFHLKLSRLCVNNPTLNSRPTFILSQRTFRLNHTPLISNTPNSIPFIRRIQIVYKFQHWDHSTTFHTISCQPYFINNHLNWYLRPSLRHSSVYTYEEYPLILCINTIVGHWHIVITPFSNSNVSLAFKFLNGIFLILGCGQ